MRATCSGEHTERKPMNAESNKEINAATLAFTKRTRDAAPGATRLSGCAAIHAPSTIRSRTTASTTYSRGPVC